MFLSFGLIMSGTMKILVNKASIVLHNSEEKVFGALLAQNICPLN